MDSFSCCLFSSPASVRSRVEERHLDENQDSDSQVRTTEPRKNISPSTGRVEIASPIGESSPIGERGVIATQPSIRQSLSGLATATAGTIPDYRIQLKCVNNEQVERYYWTGAYGRLNSIISQEDMFRLVGSKAPEGIVLIDGKAHKVFSDAKLEPGQIILNPNYQDLASGSLVMSACVGRIQYVMSVVVSVEKKSGQDDKIRTYDWAFDSALQNLLGGMPVDSGRSYAIDTFCLDESEKLFWNDFEFQAFPTPAATPKGDAQNAVNTVLVYAPGNLTICAESENTDNLEFIKNQKVIADCVQSTFACIDSRENTVKLSAGQFRLIKPSGLSGTEALIPVKIGDWVYFAEPFLHEEGVSEKIEMNILTSLPDSPKVRFYDGMLTRATSCELDLSWHRHYIAQDSITKEKVNEIKDCIKKALKKVPLQLGKAFTAKLSGEQKKDLLIFECRIKAVSGDDTDNCSGVFIADDKTQLHLNASDQSIVKGGVPQGRNIEDVLKLLNDGLAGIDEVAQQVAQRIILPFGKEGGEKGLLLYGPPGTGKSALAGNIGKALQALDKNVLFVKSASLMTNNPADSVKKLNDLFDKARKMTPNDKKKEPFVIFLDEIDAILPKHGLGTDARTAIQSALQTIMDGGTKSDIPNVVVIGTTNCDPKSLPEALLRKGRFSVQLEMSFPNYSQRQKQLEYGLARLQDKGSDIDQLDCELLARMTEKKSCKDIADLVNEASLNAASAGTKTLSDQHFYNALTNPDMVKITKKKAMGHFPLSSAFQATGGEKLALQKIGALLKQVSSGSSKKGIIIIEAKQGTRKKDFCHQLLKNAESFDNYSAVPSSRSMINSCLQGVSSAETALKSLIIVEDAEKMAAQGSALEPAGDIGSAWLQFRNSPYKSAAFVLVVNDSSNVDQLLKVLDIKELPRGGHVKLPTRISQAEMESYLNVRFTASGKDINKLVEIFTKREYPIATFVDLVNFWSRKDNNKTTWDFEEIKSALLRDEMPYLTMYS